MPDLGNIDWNQLAFTASVWVLPVLLAVTLHEAAHGFVARALGDDTAHRLGRVTLNPFKHVDGFGTVIMPAMLLLLSGGRIMFGYAKPVPVNFGELNNPRRDMVLVAAAGPAANVLIALVCAVSLLLMPFLEGDLRDWVGLNLVNAVWINILLALFNMLPIPPLDGGRVAVGLLPFPLAVRLAALERFGMLIVLVGVFVLPLVGNQIGVDLNVFWWLVGEPSTALMRGLLSALGVI